MKAAEEINHGDLRAILMGREVETTQTVAGEVNSMRRMAMFMYSKLRWAIVPVAAFAVFTGEAVAQLAVDELEVFMRPVASGQRTATIRVTNPSDKPVQAVVEIQDWDRDELGANRFMALGEESHSCKERLTVFPRSLRIDAGRTETLRVSFNGPADDACWGIVFIQGEEPRPVNAQASQITYVVRTGVKIYVEPANATRVGDVDDVRIVEIKQPRTADAGSDSIVVKNVEIAFRNGGTSHLKTRGTVEVRSADNAQVARLDVLEFPSTPGALRRVLLPLPELKPGRYIALALLDYAGDEIAAGQVEFEVR